MGKLEEAFEYKGFFWLPETPDVEIPGALRYTPDDGVRLELQGVLHAPADDSFHPPSFKDAPLILGVTTQGKEVSLLDCIQVKGNIGTGWKYWGTPETAYRVTRAFLDVHFPSIKAVEFEGIMVNYTYLDEWIDQNPFHVDHQSISEMALSYKAPEFAAYKN